MQSILKEHVLPRLAGLGNTALWLHFAEEAVAFERGLSPLRGLPMPAGSDELAESTEEPWTDGSCLELLARQPVSTSLLASILSLLQLRAIEVSLFLAFSLCLLKKLACAESPFPAVIQDQVRVQVCLEGDLGAGLVHGMVER